jgi:hypothetical protein
MKARIYLHSEVAVQPSLLVEMRSEPAAGDLLDTELYGPCEVLEVVSTPTDRHQDAVVLLRLSDPPRFQG